MNWRKIGLALGLGLALVGGGVAIAQIPTPATEATIGANDLVAIAPNGQPSAQGVFVKPALLLTAHGYYKSAPATGFVYTFGNNIEYAMFKPSGGIATGYIYLAAAPSDGMENCFFTTQTITTLTVYGGTTAQTLNNGVTTLSANTRNCYNYSLSNNTWDRSQ